MVSSSFTLRQWFRLTACILTLLLLAISGSGMAHAQQDRKRKVPVLDKLSSGSSHQAFSGRVQSLDMERKILNVNTVQGGNTEIFPIKKGIHVATAGGDKLKLADLTPGTNVLIYYEQRGDRRTVKEIVVLAAGGEEDKKKSAPPS